MRRQTGAADATESTGRKGSRPDWTGMSSPVIRSHPHPDVALLTLNRPEARNALSLQLRRELVGVLNTCARDERCRVLILTGAGTAFCAGLDLQELGSNTAGLVPEEGSDPVAALARFPQPVIAAVNGACVTGGFELALACDIRIASDQARFADTHARLGVMPGWGLSQRLSRIVGLGRAKELSFTGRFLGARQAAEWGLVNEVVPAAQLLDCALKMAVVMTSASRDMLYRYKSVIDSGFALDLQSALEMEAERAKEFNSRVTSDAFDRYRQQVAARDRAQG